MSWIHVSCVQIVSVIHVSFVQIVSWLIYGEYLLPSHRHVKDSVH